MKITRACAQCGNVNGKYLPKTDGDKSWLQLTCTRCRSTAWTHTTPKLVPEPVEEPVEETHEEA